MNCDFCGALLPDRVLVCYACGRLTYGKRLAARAREAEGLEQRGDLAGAREAWSETLTFLPEDARQASEIRARIAKLEGQSAARTPNLRRAAGIAGTLGALAVAIKAKLGLAVSLVKGSKVLLTASTMLLSIWVYTGAMGARFAALFVLLIWVHEMGHVVALRWFGVPASGPVFIPFLGALVRLKQNPPDVVVDAWSGLAGPVFGSIGGWITLALARHLGSELLLVVGHVTIQIQLFNLIPLHPLDGGRAAGILTPRLWVIGLAALGALAWHLGEPVLVIAAFLPLGRITEGARILQHGLPGADFWRASPAQRVAAFAAYLGLVALLVGTHMAFEPSAHAVLEKHKGSTIDLAWITSATE